MRAVVPHEQAGEREAGWPRALRYTLVFIYGDGMYVAKC